MNRSRRAHIIQPSQIRLLLLVVYQVIAGTAVAGDAPTLAERYEILELGFTDAAHTPDNGVPNSTIFGINTDGSAVGHSTRFVGAPNSQSAWWYDPELRTIHRVGLVDALHTGADATQISEVSAFAGGSLAGASAAPNNSWSVWWNASPAQPSQRIGFYDERHIDPSGIFQSNVEQVLANGAVLGRSFDFNAGSPTLWHFDPSTQETRRLGLHGPSYRSPTERFATEVTANNSNGQVIGNSEFFEGSHRSIGEDSWFYDPQLGTNQRINIDDEVHRQPNGSRESRAIAISNRGHVIGWSMRFFNDRFRSYGTSAWAFDPSTSTTVQLGLLDDQHVWEEGKMARSSPRHVNENGFVMGTSARFADGGGTSVWLFDPNSRESTRIGLLDRAHRHNSGRRESLVHHLNGDNQATGYSLRFAPSSGADSGQSAWFFDPSDGFQTRIGLFDEQHTHDSALHETFIESSDNRRFVIGRSKRFSPSGPRNLSSRGQSGWAFDRFTRTTTRLGLLGPEHTSERNDQWTQVVDQTELGQIVGNSRRYLSEGPFGLSGWLYNSESDTTVEIGPQGAEYVREDGIRDTMVLSVFGEDLILGQSTRYNGLQDLGDVPWIMDASDGTLETLLFSESNNGKADTDVFQVFAEGYLLGRYRRFDGDVDEGYFPFFWSQAAGFVDVESLLGDSLRRSGWDRLQDVAGVGVDGTIYGTGLKRSDSSPYEFPFVLAPTDKLPATLPGDSDANGILNADDFDFLASAIQAGDADPLLDFNEDGLVDASDLDFWVEDIMKTNFGDANLDGRFDSSDLILVFRAGEYEDTLGRNSGWAEGDWNGDAEFNSGDMIRAFATGAYDRNPESIAVPEPTAVSLLWATLFAIISPRSRHPSKKRFLGSEASRRCRT